MGGSIQGINRLLTVSSGMIVVYLFGVLQLLLCTKTRYFIQFLYFRELKGRIVIFHHAFHRRNRPPNCR